MVKRKAITNMNDFDETELHRLVKNLSEHIEEFEWTEQIVKFSGGQSNPTYRIDTPQKTYVLRRQPKGKILGSAHAVDREYRIMRALWGSQVPVPKVLYLCVDPEVIGTIFYVMEYVEGQIHWNPALPDLPVSERRRVYGEMCKALSNLHNVDFQKLGLEDFGKPGRYLERQLARWTTQYRKSQTEDNEAMEALISWLKRNIPDGDERVAVIHGDYRMDNIIFDSGNRSILAILDWELSTLGHPYLDLAYQCMQLRLDSKAIIPGLGGLDRVDLGIPSEEEYVGWYCYYSDIDSIDNWNYYLVFSYFKFSAIMQGIQKRALEGNASSRLAEEYGALARPLSEAGLQLTL